MKRFIKSLGYALNGWKLFFINEKNGQIQLAVAVLVFIAGFVFKISCIEWMAVLLCMALVLALEMTNSVLEKWIDFLHPAENENIKWIKDVAAGAVLWAAVLSAIIGGIIFLPKIF
jgi:diacylglycerol kinase